MKDKFQLGDAVYVPSEDPKAEIIYTIVARSKEYARLHHSTEPAKVLPMSQIEQPPL
jgi:hypothetical protein